jgi:hypothetical protein
MLAVAACGGGDSPGPSSTVRTYYRALLAGDGSRACAQLTPALERDVGASRGARAAGGTCTAVMHLASGLNPDRAGDDLNGLKVDLRTTGDRSHASLTNPLTGKRETIDLTRARGDWKIATLVLRPRR